MCNASAMARPNASALGAKSQRISMTKVKHLASRWKTSPKLPGCDSPIHPQTMYLQRHINKNLHHILRTTHGVKWLTESSSPTIEVKERTHNSKQGNIPNIAEEQRIKLLAECDHSPILTARSLMPHSLPCSGTLPVATASASASCSLTHANMARCSAVSMGKCPFSANHWNQRAAKYLIPKAQGPWIG